MSAAAEDPAAPLTDQQVAERLLVSTGRTIQLAAGRDGFQSADQLQRLTEPMLEAARRLLVRREC